MEELLEMVRVNVMAIVDYPDQVEVSAEGSRVHVVIVIKAHPEDYRRIIGRKGKNLKAIETLVDAATHAIAARDKSKRLNVTFEMAKGRG